jgi:hypothetical protein
LVKTELPEIAPEMVPVPETDPPEKTIALEIDSPVSSSVPPDSVTDPEPRALSSPKVRVPLETVVPPE